MCSEIKVSGRKEHQALVQKGFKFAGNDDANEVGEIAEESQFYQALILATLQTLAGTHYLNGSHGRDELAPGLRNYHLVYSRQQAKHLHSSVKSPSHIVFYR